ncbi:DUF1707 SHOCT-like domain-containing protein [Prauserella rugosa]|uniref:Uncharacterized protein DUF1707 n=1 Tax=Prauserella rugosa TaxID=43354 RepID=A0A660CE46_9PSEU|nr:DUF1707 domain-containing protein [Prauserella rugosa]KID28764.1 protein of unknown function (DUF1707) [Prauserella sp. Am3]KMS85684.1 hypothetical protein ACZ91_40950 [Streptomyces regensis]TWH21662.1 uncharacterized protein DUF1707 [Prauserella rugosa]
MTESANDPAAAGGATPGDLERERQRNLRVSDAEREHVVELLQRAIGHGMLDLDEFTERTDTALAARTRGELNAVLVDLPGLHHEHAVPAQGASSFARPSRPRTDPSQRAEIKGVGSTLVRRGRWQVPPALLVRNKYGETKLDFSEAEFTTDVVTVELDTKWGSVNIIVPDRAAVDLSELDELKWSTLNDKTNSSHTSGRPLIVVTGRVVGGTVTLRHPRRSWFG